MEPETILVTGGTGFIGSHTAKVLVEQGHDVVATDVATDTQRLEKLGVLDALEFRRLDLTDPVALTRVLRRTGATRIVHLGAVTSLIAVRDPRAAVQVNVVGTNNVLEAARTLDDQVERVAWASTMAVYAPSAKYDHEPVDEDDLVYPSSIYGATKEFCEHQARVYREEFGVSAVGLRPTGVYGPFNTPEFLGSGGDEPVRHRSPSGRLAGLFSLAAQERPVALTTSGGAMDFIYVEDVARLFAAAAFAPEADLTRDVYNAASGESASVEDVAAVIRELLPEADISLTVEGESPYVSDIDGSAARADLGVDIEYDLRAGIEAYLNAIRADRGLPPVDGG